MHFPEEQMEQTQITVSDLVNSHEHLRGWGLRPRQNHYSGV